MNVWCRLVSLVLCWALTVADENYDIPSAEPEYLDMLLLTERYEEFAALAGIENVDLVRPAPANSNKDPTFNEGLEFCTILPTPQRAEQARQGLNFTNDPGKKWPRSGVPYTISTAFLPTNRRLIQKAIEKWNSTVDYFFPTVDYPGSGCSSNLGKIGGSQMLSLSQNGCMREGTILHEMDHVIGFSHEHNRLDRDENVKVLTENISPQWRAQYEKNTSPTFEDQLTYDYYSVLHYPIEAPDNDRPAFEILKGGIDESRIGQRDGFTDTDLKKISVQYC